MKKTTIYIVISSFIVGLLWTTSTLQATNFEGQEETYITLCKSSSLSPNDQETCKEFNSYLKNKNKDLNTEIVNKKNNISDAQTNITTIENELSSIKNSILNKESEIAYLETSITHLENSISTKEEQIRDRMYSMQSYMNTNFYVDFIFTASNFTDMLSRMDSLNELTSHDKDLIASLLEDKKSLVTQQDTMSMAKSNLESQLTNQESLQNQYLALYQEQNAALVAHEKSLLENSDASETIDDNLAALAAASKESEVFGVVEATPPANPTPPPSNENNNNNNTNTGGNNNENSGSTPPPEETPPPTHTGNYEIGLRIANAALSKQGSPYGWGAAGPNAFDCSGLVHWSHKQVGVNFTRTTAAKLAGMGKAVAYKDLQAGDIVTFKTDPSRVSHVGIYIGNGKMVHAPTFNVPVQVVDLSSRYWQNCYYNARRLY